MEAMANSMTKLEMNPFVGLFNLFESQGDSEFTWKTDLSAGSAARLAKMVGVGAGALQRLQFSSPRRGFP